MVILRSGGMGDCVGEMKRPEVCKPDYERLILDAKAKKSKAESLRDAIFNYTGDRSPQDVLAAMVGELAFEIRSLETAIGRLIEQQESEK